MQLVKSCCGLCDLKSGARKIAILSMIYDLLMIAGLLLVLLICVPFIPFEAPVEQHKKVEYNVMMVYQIMLIISIAIRVIHTIPSFLLLYSTWEEIPRGVGSWLFIGTIDVFLHASWLVIPILFKWKLDRLVIAETFLLIGIFTIIYFLCVISSYKTWIEDRYQDVKSRRRLKEYY